MDQADYIPNLVLKSFSKIPLLNKSELDNYLEIDQILNKIDIHPHKSFSGFGRRISIVSVLSYSEELLNKNILVAGWIRTIRKLGQGKYIFLELNDGSTVKHLQVIILNIIPCFQSILEEGIGACVFLKGRLVKSIGNKQDHYIRILGKCDVSNYKLIKSKDKIKVEKLRDLGHLRPRSNIIGCITRIRSNLGFAVHLFFQNLNFLYINTPIITKCNCEPEQEQFTVTTLLEGSSSSRRQNQNKILENNINKNNNITGKSVLTITEENNFDPKSDFFHEQVFLTSSGQLELESYACAFSDVYNFGPCFRAEYNFNERHLAEFWMIECEVCFADLSDVMSLSEKLIKFCLDYTLKHNKSDLDYIANHYEKNVYENIKNAIFVPYVRINYTDVIEILLEASNTKKNIFKDSVTWGISLSPEHERYLTDVYFKSPVFIYDFPKRVKSFYMKVNEDQETVSAMDLIIPGIGEILGGSEREDSYTIMEDNIKKEFGINAQNYKSYLDLRKFGTVPHSGFGLGFDRLVMLVTGMKDIKDVSPYPRYPDYSEF